MEGKYVPNLRIHFLTRLADFADQSFELYSELWLQISFIIYSPYTDAFCFDNLIDLWKSVGKQSQTYESRLFRVC